MTCKVIKLTKNSSTNFSESYYCIIKAKLEFYQRWEAGLTNVAVHLLQGESEGAAAMVPSDDEGEMEDMKARLEALRS